MNTSFNVRGEPIVESPEDCVPLLHGHRYRTATVVGNCVLRKEDQPAKLRLDYKEQFELD